MSFMIKDTKERIKQLEQALANSDNGWRQDDIANALASYKKKLLVLENTDLNKIAADMKIIMSHTQAVDDKYNCRSVKMMFAIADFLDKPRCVSKSLAKWIREYTINKINAPVCSIVSSPKPELPPMPGYMDPIATEMAAHRKAEQEELLKFREITNRLYEKPTRWELTKARIRAYVNRVLA